MSKLDKTVASLLWPRPREISLFSGGFRSKGPLSLRLSGDAGWLKPEAGRIVGLLNRAAGKRFVGPEPSDSSFIVCGMEDLPSRYFKPVKQAEGYILLVGDREIILAGSDASGAFYGAQTLAKLLAESLAESVNSRLPRLFIRDWPAKPLRGAHMFLPARKNMGFFLDLLDLLAELKYNTLFLEIGGGMELRRHPEINRAWRKFCKEADAYDPRQDKHKETMRATPDPTHTYGATALQTSRFFPKDSTHTELAGGEWLKRGEVERIVRECAARHIAIVPEVQTLSHAYWLCCAHPEIAERKDDPWPDTYCPSNPRSYRLLFDVMDEIIEVFQPRIMHIGHDELMHIAQCPRCKGKSGHKIFADDVRKIHGFLAARGIRTAMWGDKLMEEKYGGFARKRREKETGRVWSMPATYKAINSIPKDIIIMDWFWGNNQAETPEETKWGKPGKFGGKQAVNDAYFPRHGFDRVFGNFIAQGCAQWEKRAKSAKVLGAEVSSWCDVSAEAFGHNRVITDFFPTADALWSGKQTPNPQVHALMARWMPPVMDRLLREKRWIVSGEGKTAPINLAGAAVELPRDLRGKLMTGRAVKTALGTGGFKVCADSQGALAKAATLDVKGRNSVAIPIGRKVKALQLLLGTTMEDIHLQLTFNSYHRGPGELLEYRVKYADGKTVKFISYYGQHVGVMRGYWPFPYVNWVYNTCYRAVPAAIGKNRKMYVHEWRNPRPNARIAEIEARLGKDAKENGVALIAAITAVV